MKIIILAGGAGSRLFPLSNKETPKQFLKINSPNTLLQNTVLRFLNLVSGRDIIVVTNNKYEAMVQKDLEEIDCQSAHVILEPCKRNTASAIALAMQYCRDVLSCSEDEVMFVSPSDHIIEPQVVFMRALVKALEVAQKNKMVLFGINIDRPETGFGYIEIGPNFEDCYHIQSFKEKPDFATAKQYMNSKRYFWNSGMFAFSVGMYRQELATYCPNIFNNLGTSYQETLQNFSLMPDISIDYAIMEKSHESVLLPLNVYWSDIGSWDAVYSILDKDSGGNAVLGEVKLLDAHDNLCFADDKKLIAAGVEDLRIIVHDKYVVVLKKGYSQCLKELL